MNRIAEALREEGLLQLRKDAGKPVDMTPKSRYPNNGAMTKHIMQAAKSPDVDLHALYEFTKRVLSRWPMSSTKVIYDMDLKELPAPVKAVLEKAAVEHDQITAERGIEMMMDRHGATREKAIELITERGMFGRAKIASLLGSGRVASALSAEGLTKVSSSYADLEKVLDELGKVEKIRYTPGSGKLSAVVTIDGTAWSIEGTMDQNGTLTYVASPAASPVHGTVDIPYEYHHDAAHDMLQRIRFHR